MNTPQDTSFWQNRPKDDTHMDWHYTNNDWIGGYKDSVSHPHREVMLTLLQELMPFKSLLEVGCSVGPNLRLIHEAFPEVTLCGIDPSQESVIEAQDFLSGTGVTVHLGDARSLFYDEADVVLADASLMYITPEEIEDVMNKIAFTAKKAVIIVDRHNDSKLGENTGGVWGRDYETLLKERGFKVVKVKIDADMWPGSPNWAKYGYFWVGVKNEE